MKPLPPNCILWQTHQTPYSLSTTTRINFQIKLHETTSMMEFCYGPVTAGTYSGPDTGASICIKDATGDSYHFLDVYADRSGSPTIGVSTLNPLTQWPGNNMAYHIYPNVVTTNVSISAKWNLISNPYVETANVVDMFPTAQVGTTYKYVNGYVASSTLVPGIGYWTKFPGTVTECIQGAFRPSIDAVVKGGWNLVCGPTQSIAAYSAMMASTVL